jgi:hypothetical protein
MMQDGRAPLYIAAQIGHLEVVKHLLSVGADKDKADEVNSVLSVDIYG